MSTLPRGLRGHGHCLSKALDLCPCKGKQDGSPKRRTPQGRWRETFSVQSRPSLGRVPGTNRPFGGPNWPHLGHLPEAGSGLPCTRGAGHLPGPPALRPRDRAPLSQLGRGPRPRRPGSAPSAWGKGAPAPFPGA